MTTFPDPHVPLLDPGRLPDWLEPSDRANLLRLFLESTEETLALLRRAETQTPRESQSLGHVLHGLKGAAVSVGALRLANLAKVHEMTLPHMNDDMYAQCVRDLADCLKATEAAMQTHLGPL